MSNRGDEARIIQGLDNRESCLRESCLDEADTFRLGLLMVGLSLRQRQKIALVGLVPSAAKS